MACKDRLRNEFLRGSQVNRGFFWGVHRWTRKSGTPWHPDGLTPQSLYVPPSCGKSFREHRRDRSFPHWLLQLQRWLKTEPLCGVNTNSQKPALLWEFYSLMEKNGRKGILLFSFYREPQRFETCSSIHSSVYLGAWFPCKSLRIRYFACERQWTHAETQEGGTYFLVAAIKCHHCLSEAGRLLPFSICLPASTAFSRLR